jgi:hypothetical protein
MDGLEVIIEALPDLRIGRYSPERYKYFNIPQLEYVCEIANYLLPVIHPEDDYCDSYSPAPAIFANRYLDSMLTIEERYERAIAIDECPYNDYTSYEQAQQHVRLLDRSFENRYLNNRDLQNTIEAFGLDVSKFWYFLVFIKDYIEDLGTNAPVIEMSAFEDCEKYFEALRTTETVILKNTQRKIYETKNDDTIALIWCAMNYYIKSYNKLVEDNPADMKDRLEKMGWNLALKNASYQRVRYDELYNLDISHKKWKFANILLYFLKDRKATIIKHGHEFISKDKMTFISRLIYTIEYDSARYNEEYKEDGEKNRMLSNLLRRYSKEEFPPVTGRLYKPY